MGGIDNKVQCEQRLQNAIDELHRRGVIAASFCSVVLVSVTIDCETKVTTFSLSHNYCPRRRICSILRKIFSYNYPKIE